LRSGSPAARLPSKCGHSSGGQAALYCLTNGQRHQSLGELGNIELPEDAIVINAAGKEGATGLVQFLESKAGQSKVFVDIRPHLDIAVVERAKELGWQAHTGLGMNTRNDHALVTGITNYLRVPTPSFARIRTTCIRGIMNVGASAHEDNV
jgi:hypothetical protein